MNGGCSDFLMYVAFVYSLLLRTFHNEARLSFFSFTSHQVSKKKVYMAPSGAIIYLLFVPNIISVLFPPAQKKRKGKLLLLEL